MHRSVLFYFCVDFLSSRCSHQALDRGGKSRLRRWPRCGLQRAHAQEEPARLLQRQSQARVGVLLRIPYLDFSTWCVLGLNLLLLFVCARVLYIVFFFVVFFYASIWLIFCCLLSSRLLFLLLKCDWFCVSHKRIYIMHGANRCTLPCNLKVMGFVDRLTTVVSKDRAKTFFSAAAQFYKASPW